MTEPDFRQTWETYTESWKAESNEARRSAYALSLVPECTYTDPNVAATGYDEIAEYMHGFQQQMPGAGFVTRTFSTHHNTALVQWDMIDGDNNVVGQGASFGAFEADGRLHAMTGFFDQNPA